MVQSQFPEYLGVLILLLLAVAAPFGMILVSLLLGKRGKRNPVKDSAYECGIAPVGPGNSRLSVRFYLVAMLFILFDIEVVFLYPWAVNYKSMLGDPDTRNLIFGSMITFIGILFFGYCYALKKRAFNWKD
ncbi:MAG: NADH-quinone oxidoreductase subunit A [Verrucomicrobiota bacterium]